ncbi:MAG: hypothetical protein RID91_21795 [Azospirillaceae bacterium]
MTIVLWVLAGWFMLSLPVGILVGRMIRFGSGAPLPATVARRGAMLRHPSSSPWARPAR